MAHEFAHNILRHRDRLNAARASRGVLGVGRGVSSIRQTEIEADRLSVYLMERAGYDPGAAVRFWTRYGPHPLNFLRSRDHPAWRERVRLMEVEIAKIRAARAAGRTPAPDFVTLPGPA
jgi:predicted Zn-dependent protease